MDMSTGALVRLLWPLTPLILKIALLNTLSLSQCSTKQDVTTEVTVAIIRSMLTTRKPLGSMQKYSIRDPGIKGKVWISKATISAPTEPDVLDAVIQGIKCLGRESDTYAIPQTVPVQGEWTGFRKDAGKNEPRLEIPEQEQYVRMMSEVSSNVTILYFHGGAYFLMDPASHRLIVSNLAKRTGGRAFSVRYRLAPQNPFPSQLLDALMAYLYLQSPPAGAFHEPVPAKDIIFAGDSAGGNLATALMLLIVTLRQNGLSSINFHGKSVPLETPAGIAGNSPWLDITNALPSIRTNAPYDYLGLDTIRTDPAVEYPEDEIWPASPPRIEIFCNASILKHAIVSPVNATPSMWKGMSPAFLCLGTESLQDGIEITARRMHQSGGYVEVAGYDGAPHCFAMIFPTSQTGKDCLDKWAKFCVDAVEGKLQGPGKVEWVSRTMVRSALPLEEVSHIPDEEVDSAIDRMSKETIEQEVEAVRLWSEKKTEARL